MKANYIVYIYLLLLLIKNINCSDIVLEQFVSNKWIIVDSGNSNSDQLYYKLDIQNKETEKFKIKWTSLEAKSHHSVLSITSDGLHETMDINIHTSEYSKQLFGVPTPVNFTLCGFDNAVFSITCNNWISNGDFIIQLIPTKSTCIRDDENSKTSNTSQKESVVNDITDEQSTPTSSSTSEKEKEQDGYGTNLKPFQHGKTVVDDGNGSNNIQLPSMAILFVLMVLIIL